MRDLTPDWKNRPAAAAMMVPAILGMLGLLVFVSPSGHGQAPAGSNGGIDSGTKIFGGLGVEKSRAERRRRKPLTPVPTVEVNDDTPVPVDENGTYCTVNSIPEWKQQSDAETQAGKTPPKPADPYPNASKPKSGSSTDKGSRPVDPVVLEQDFISFNHFIPLRPGLLDLTTYELNRMAYSVPILSPDRLLMAVSDVYFIPWQLQTMARVNLYDTGEPPEEQDLVPPPPPSRRSSSSKSRQAQPATVDVSKINPHQFWDQYDPRHQQFTRQPVWQHGFDQTKRGQTDIIQVVDWGLDSKTLLMAWRPSILHLGIRKTIPVIYDVDTRQASRRLYLPQRIWDDFLARHPEFEDRDMVWDVVPVGFNSARPSSEVLFRLVQFRRLSSRVHAPAETITSGFWAYNIKNHQLKYLAPMVCPKQIATNGWIVEYKDPNAKDEYGDAKVYDRPEDLPDDTAAPDEEVENAVEDGF